MRMSLALALALSTGVLGAPALAADTKPLATKDSSTTIFLSKSAGPSPTTNSLYPSPTVPYTLEDLNKSYLDKFQNKLPEPICGLRGANVLGPQNVELNCQNPDILAPPTTDSGLVKNVKWPFSLSHNHIQDGGWARQQNVHLMPIATTMAGVNMHLKAGTMREMHWHITAEYPGDLWYFPPGIPHVLQGLNDTADGCEFLLVFDNGEFSEDSTFLVTDWASHIPKEVLSQNFKVNASAFDHIPDRKLYMIPTAVPMGTPKEEGVKSPQGVSTLPYTFAASKINATKVPGGTVKVVNSRTFKVSKTIALAEVTVEVGGMRELHWHPTQPKWSYFMSVSNKVL
ncbi:Oxalate Decarboxylase, partial [Rhizoctonia solani]